MPDVYNENELLKQVATGDEAAFRVLYDHYRGKVLTIAAKLLATETEVLDVLQEVFVKIWLHREKLTEIGNFSAYLNTITRNHLYNVLRRQAYQEALLAELALKPEEADAGPAEPLDMKALKQALLTAVRALPPRQQRVFELSKLDGLKQEEIAVLMNISRETVKKHLAEAMRNLRSGLSSQQHVLALLLVLNLTN